MATFYDYFNITYGQGEYHSKRNLVELKNGIPLISSKGTHQGIYGYFDIKPEYKHAISVPSTGTVCCAFYQGENCCIDDNCLVMVPKRELSIQEMIYFALLVRKEKYKYMYGRQVTPDRLGNTEIPDVPKWVNEKVIASFDNFDEAIFQNKINLNAREWKEFTYDTLFTVKKGKRVIVKKIKAKQGKYNFVSAIKNNNGVFCKTNLEPNQSANVITINYDGNGGVAETFYQDKPFWALDSVNVLYPRYPDFKLNPFIALFLVTLIRKERYRFNYGRKWNKERMEKSTILLPVDDKGNPDWNFMENYIKNLKYSKDLEKFLPIQ